MGNNKISIKIDFEFINLSSFRRVKAIFRLSSEVTSQYYVMQDIHKMLLAFMYL